MNKSFMFKDWFQFHNDKTSIYVNCNGVTQRFLDEHDITLEEYEKMNESNICCFNCYKCKNCINCEGCHECINCEGCHECINCEKCMRCNECTKCNNSLYSSNCKKCSNCELCTRCENCKHCQSCEECLSCSKCNCYRKNILDMLNIIHVKGLY